MNISDESIFRFFHDLVRDFSQAHSTGSQNSPESEFLQQQFSVIEAYVQGFPCEERDFRALAWIEANAGQYRQQWQVQAAGGRQLHSTVAH